MEKDLEVSVAGRSFMITGANSGIGKATAMAVAKRGTLLKLQQINLDMNPAKPNVLIWFKEDAPDERVSTNVLSFIDIL